MITAEFCQTMARYNRWQNESHIAAAEGLSQAALDEDRGAFFSSIQRTMNHTLWGDQMWMSRFDGWDKPGGTPGGMDMFDTLAPYIKVRREADSRIVAWADNLKDADLLGNLSWYSGVLKADVQKPLAMLVQQLFNHQTHHRGQVHAMLTAAGAKPDDTDLFLMPGLEETY